MSRWTLCVCERDFYCLYLTCDDAETFVCRSCLSLEYRSPCMCRRLCFSRHHKVDILCRLRPWTLMFSWPDAAGRSVVWKCILQTFITSWGKVSCNSWSQSIVIMTLASGVLVSRQQRRASPLFFYFHSLLLSDVVHRCPFLSTLWDVGLGHQIIVFPPTVFIQQALCRDDNLSCVTVSALLWHGKAGL